MLSKKYSEFNLKHIFIYCYCVKKLMKINNNIKHASIYRMKKKPTEITHETSEIKFIVKKLHTTDLYRHGIEDETCTNM